MYECFWYMYEHLCYISVFEHCAYILSMMLQHFVRIISLEMFLHFVT